MSDKEKKKFSWGRFAKKAAIRIPIFIILLGALLIVSLKMVVRHPESLRAGLEDYFSKATNTRASINSIDEVAFYPDMNIRISDLSLHAGSNAANVFLHADTLEVGSPFWSLITPIKRLDHLKMENVSFSEGFIFKHPMSLKKLEIIEKEGPEQYGAFIVGNGTYAEKDMTIEIGIEKIKERYKLPSAMPISIVIGDVSVNATFVRDFAQQYFNNAVLKINDEQSIAKDYDFFVEGEYQIDNPVNCVFDHINNIEECNKYLESTEGDQTP